MENNEQSIIKATFKKSKVVEIIVFLLITYSFFAVILFLDLGIEALRAGNVSAALAFNMCFIFVIITFCGIAYEWTIRKSKIELYNEKLVIKHGFSKEKIIGYDEIIDVSQIDYMVISTEKKSYYFPKVINSFDIITFISRKLKKHSLVLDEEEKNYKKIKKKLLFSVLACAMCVVVLLSTLIIRDGISSQNVFLAVFFVASDLAAFALLIVFGKLIERFLQLYWDSREKYREALFVVHLNDNLDENTVRVFEESCGGRTVVIYKDKKYKCLHETFVLKNKSWFTYLESKSFDNLADAEKYIEISDDEKTTNELTSSKGFDLN